MNHLFIQSSEPDEFFEYSNLLLTEDILRKHLRLDEGQNLKAKTKAATRVCYAIYRDVGQILRMMPQPYYTWQDISDCLLRLHKDMSAQQVKQALALLDLFHDLFIPSVMVNGVRLYDLKNAWETPAAKLAIQSNLWLTVNQRKH